MTATIKSHDSRLTQPRFSMSAEIACQPTVVDLFCGAGGISEGFRQAGFTVLAGSDNDPDAMIGILEHMNPDDFAVAPMPLGPDGKAFPSIGYAGFMMMDTTYRDREIDLVLLTHDRLLIVELDRGNLRCRCAFAFEVGLGCDAVAPLVAHPGAASG